MMHKKIKATLLSYLLTLFLMGGTNVVFAQQAPSAPNTPLAVTTQSAAPAQSPSASTIASSSVPMAADQVSQSSSGNTAVTTTNTPNPTNDANANNPLAAESQQPGATTNPNSAAGMPPAAPATTAPAGSVVSPIIDSDQVKPNQPNSERITVVPDAPVEQTPPPTDLVPRSLGIVITGPSEEYAGTRGPRDFTRILNKVPTTTYSPELPGEK